MVRSQGSSPPLHTAAAISRSPLLPSSLITATLTFPPPCTPCTTTFTYWCNIQTPTTFPSPSTPHNHHFLLLLQKRTLIFHPQRPTMHNSYIPQLSPTGVTSNLSPSFHTGTPYTKIVARLTHWCNIQPLTFHPCIVSPSLHAQGARAHVLGCLHTEASFKAPDCIDLCFSGARPFYSLAFGLRSGGRVG